MRRSKDPVLIGPIPPPVDGRAVATSWLVDALAAAGCPVRVIDTQLPEGRLRVLRKSLRCLQGALTLLFGGHPHLVVIASGYQGLLLELPPLLAARLRGTSAYMAHHVSHYVRKARWPMRCALRIGGPRLRHIFLCAPMRDEFGATYDVDVGDAVVLDNAALVPGFHDPSVQRERSILHLSNLSRAKGSLTAIDVARSVRVPLWLVGPADPDVRNVLDRCPPSKGIEHLGPVSHAAKAAVFSRSRVFLFPTEYELEAQPLVLYEAASGGAIPVTWDVGWIRDQMQRLGLGCYVAPAGDTAALADLVRRLVHLPDEQFAELSALTVERFEQLRKKSQAAISDLAVELSHRRSSPRDDR